ncbi:hypothetical protein [Sabulibacter ruber]|uniref:hypothetical protein n=1 Tax=Sabulibacter ruber TaxID=2811901 RepID=UPI001A95CFB1|nr:hypothetical protein [Sabulibacter ruber]
MIRLTEQGKARLVSFGIATAVLTGFCFFLSYFLKTNFSYQGEAAMKGYGHLLEENFPKGLFVVISGNLVLSTLITHQFFLLLEREVQVIAYKLLRVAALLILALLLAYLGVKIQEGLSAPLLHHTRLIDLTLTWVLRILGFFQGYWLTKMVCTYSKHSKVPI